MKVNKFSPMRQKNKMRNEKVKQIFIADEFYKFAWSTGLNQYQKHYVGLMSDFKASIDNQYRQSILNQFDNEEDLNKEIDKTHNKRLMEALRSKGTWVEVRDEPLRMRHIYLENVTKDQLKVIRQMIKDNVKIKISILNVMDRKSFRNRTFSRLHRYVRYEINNVEVNDICDMIEKYKNNQLKNLLRYF